MKFATDQDAKMFCFEIERFDAASDADKNFKPDRDMIEIFLKKRRELIPGLKNFRKTQNTKQQWRGERYKMMRGIKRFHKSTAGKRFHRSLGRFLATRESLQENFTSFYLTEVAEVLKAFSSLETHAYIELEYYHPLAEELEFRILFDELIPAISRIKNDLMSGRFMFEDSDEELLLRVIDHQDIFASMAETHGVNCDDIQKLCDSILDTEPLSTMNEEADGYYRLLFEQIEDQISQLPKKVEEAS